MTYKEIVPTFCFMSLMLAATGREENMHVCYIFYASIIDRGSEPVLRSATTPFLNKTNKQESNTVRIFVFHMCVWVGEAKPNSA